MSDSLVTLARRHGTDKEGAHWYGAPYDRVLSRYRDARINLLEIGVGGYDDPRAGGESLRMWKDYFPLATIYGIDIHDKKSLEEDRIRIFQGSQEDRTFLTALSREAGGFDVIIDDGSHICAHVIASFKCLFALLNTGGIYAIEDLQTSYWPAYGGSSTNLDRKTTSMGFLKGLVDGLNHVEFDRPGYQPSDFDKTIASIQFFHNLAFIEKGDNQAASNIVKDNRLPTADGG